MNYKEVQYDTTPTSKRTIWETVCGKYRVVLSVCMYGPKEGPQAIPDTYYAMKAEGTQWSTISKHRQKNAAEKSVEREMKCNIREEKRLAKEEKKRVKEELRKKKNRKKRK